MKLPQFRAAISTCLLVILMAGLTVLPAYAGFKDECLARVDTLADRFVRLAEAMPQAAYTWRPMEGVRSVSEVYLHVATANYMLPRVIGTQPPEGFQPRGFEQSTTNKEEIVKHLKDSFAHLRKAIEALSDADQEKPTKMFGRETTIRGAVWNMLEHLSEHLGQSIAYARMNKVVPPWTAER